MSEVVRLNIGAGDRPVEGFESVDVKNGQKAHDLDYADGTVTEIYASHVLEHYSHLQIQYVLEHWVKKLRPGGRVRIAVPDFLKVATQYVNKKPINVQGFVMGGHTDVDDRHGCIFDKESLSEVMALAGLENIREWASDYADCSGLDVSLNLCGFKPLNDFKVEDTVAILSAPRFGPVMHMRCAYSAFSRNNVPYQITQGAYWHQALSDCLEFNLDTKKREDEYAYEFIITCDFDTVFSSQDVRDLYRLMRQFPEVDAIAPVQIKRGEGTALFGIRDDNGIPVTEKPAVEFERLLTPVTNAHFGLTIFRAQSLRDHPRPWMVPSPNDQGCWTEGKVDADMDFWKRWVAAGRSIHLANNIAVGHLEELIAWPRKDFSPVYQSAADYSNEGPPPEARR